jgi:hypothetical protein
VPRKPPLGRPTPTERYKIDGQDNPLPLSTLHKGHLRRFKDLRVGIELLFQQRNEPAD